MCGARGIGSAYHFLPVHDVHAALRYAAEAAALQVIVGLGLILQAVGVDSFDARLLGTRYLRSGVGWLRRACCNLLETN